MNHWSLLLLVLVILGCSTPPTASSPTTPTADPTPKLRPAGSPDVVILSIAGRCTADPLCTPPFDNYSYLDEEARSTVQGVASAFAAQGLKVQYFDGSGFLYRRVSRKTQVAENGYLEAEAALQRIQRDWVKGFDNPTRVVLLAHSHGTVWASLLAWNYPAVKFDYFISLDSVCFWWPQDNMINNRVIQDHYAPLGTRRPWPLNDDEGRTPCNILRVPGLTDLQDISDVKPDNVGYVLEVRAKTATVINGNQVYDDDIDYRPSGTRTNIFTIQSTRESHMEVTQRGGPAMNWVAETIGKLRLPSTLGAQRAVDLEELVPAPEGFEYAP